VLGDVHADHREARSSLQPRGARGLQAWIIIVVEDVDADDGLAAIQQPFGHMHPDEAGRTGDDDGP